ncbi:hypothetical protein E2C01_069822 [Portunus trituberculatus]|uniref:Uncharacterized protein n=1 Tax=Portunus trituberculatus TaxID=210409 RepID=A0A5B7HZY5_PORTR|nr:hypothetical protein [Portunus trituberculatus]
MERHPEPRTVNCCPTSQSSQELRQGNLAVSSYPYSVFSGALQ